MKRGRAVEIIQHALARSGGTGGPVAMLLNVVEVI